MMNKLSLAELASSLKLNKNFLIFCHKNPDPDTLGSAYALKCVLEALGAKARVACCDRPNPKFNFITLGEDLTLDFDISDYERVIAIDVGSAVQLGDYSRFSVRVDLIIDHHEMSTRFADYYEDLAPATAMIVYDIARELGLLDKLPSRFFECVYAGLSGDTGCFKYSNTTPKALVYASELVATGIDFASINYAIFDAKTKGELAAQKMALEHTEILLDGALAVLLVTNDMKKQYGINDDDIGDIISTVRTIDGVLIAVTIKETTTQGKLSVSSRANVDIDVSAICAKIGGGGHPRAAGATITDTETAEAVKMLKELFAEGIYNYGKQ